MDDFIYLTPKCVIDISYKNNDLKVKQQITCEKEELHERVIDIVKLYASEFDMKDLIKAKGKVGSRNCLQMWSKKNPTHKITISYIA